MSPTLILSSLGTTGVPVKLVTNTFRLTNTPDRALYHYHVTFKPDIQSRKLRSGLLSDHREILGPVRVFDGMQLYQPRRLDQEVISFVSLVLHDRILTLISHLR